MTPKNGNINEQLDAKFVDLFSTFSNFVSNSLARNYITGLFILLGIFLRLTFNRKLFIWIQQFVKRRKIFFLPERKERNGWCRFFYGYWDIFSGSCFPAAWFSFLGKIQLFLKYVLHTLMILYLTEGKLSSNSVEQFGNTVSSWTTVNNMWKIHFPF